MAYFKRYFDKQFKNRAKLTESVDKAVKSYIENFRKKSMPEITNKRSLLDRFFDMFSTPNYMIAGVAKSLVDNKSEDNITPLEGLIGGLKAGNPLGKGYEKGEVVFSDVLHELGWQPEGTAGKITRGVVGFALDVLFDPLTYITGGLSGVVKGSGKVGKHAKGVLTLDKARDVVKNVSKSRGIKLTEEALEDNALEVYKLYNKLRGFNREARDVTLSLGNMPFGKKIFGKLADKKITLASGKAVQKLGDNTIAPFYDILRDKIMGSKFGRLFSPDSVFYTMSKERPEQLYDVILAAEFIRGTAKDKRAMEKMIFSKTKVLADLTPAQKKEILKLMQDASKWHEVIEYAKFVDTEQGKLFKKEVEKQRAKAKKKLDALILKKNKIEEMLKIGDTNIAKARNELDALRGEYKEALKQLNVSKSEVETLRKQYQDELESFDTSELIDVEQLKEYMKLYQAELKDIIKREKVVFKENANNFLKRYDEYIANKNITKGENQLLDETKKNPLKEYEVKQKKDYAKKKAVVSTKESSRSTDVQSKIDEYDRKIDLLADELQRMNRMLKKQSGDKRAKTEQNMIKMLKDFTSLKKQRNDFVKTLNTPVVDDVVDDVVDEIMDVIITSKIPRNLNILRLEMLDELSLLIYGRKGLIDMRAYDEHIDEIVKMIRDGKSKSEIMEFVSRIEDFLSGVKPRIYSFVASEIGYDDWEKYKTSMNARIRRLKDSGHFDEAYKLEREFVDKGLKRNKFISMFRNAKTKEEVDEIIREYRTHKDINKYLDDIMEQNMEKRRARMNDHDYAINDVKTGKDRRYSDMIFHNKRFTDDDYNVIRGYLINKGINNANLDLYTKEMIAELTKMLKKEYNNMKFSSLNAIRSKNMKTGKLNKMSQREVVLSKAFNVVKEKINKSRVRNTITTDTAVNRIMRIIGDKINSVKAVKQIDVKNDMLTRKDELIKLLNETQEKIRNAQNLVKNKEKMPTNKVEINESAHQNLIDVFKKRADEITKHINEFENTQKSLRMQLAKGDITKIDELTEKVKALDEVLANDEAFETYAKVTLKADYDEAIRVRTGEVILNPNVNADEKVKQIAQMLRDDFVRMAKDEMSIDKLSRIQFEKMMLRYLPHVLTPEGEKFIRENMKELTKKGVSFGDVFGFGKKSYNPFAESRTIVYLPKKIDKETGKVLEWYKNPTIEQINNFFREALKGKNMFQEDIADIYLARAMKNLDLMYDDLYTFGSMMDNFGTKLRKNDPVTEGYKAVVNYGQLRSSVYSKAMKNVLENTSRDSEEFVQLFDVEIKRILKSFDLDERVFDDLAMPFIELNDSQISKLVDTGLVYEVNEAIVDKVNMARKLQIEKDQSAFLQMYDKFTHLIKLNQTAIMPTFHIRNKASNIFNNSFAIGSDVFDIDMQKTCWKVVRAHGDVTDIKDLKPITIKKQDGTVQVMHWDEAYQLATEYKVIDEGYFAKDIGAYDASTGILPRVNPKYDPTDTKNFVGYKIGTNIGSQIENSDRFLHFVAQLKRGLSPEDAAASVQKFMFDYFDLTMFEQRVMKRLIPYYTWLRKNAPLQLEMLLEYPERYNMIGKMAHGIEHMTPEDERVEDRYLNDFAKDWVQLPFNVTNEKGRVEPVLFNPNLPFMDIARIPDITQPINSLQNLFTQTNPLIKVPIEQMLNRNVFFERPIVDEGESQLKRVDHVLSQFAPYSAGKDLVTKRGVDWGLHVLNQLTALKMLSYDYEAYKPLRYKQLLDEYYAKERFKNNVKRGIENATYTIVSGVKNQVSNAIDYVNNQRPDSAFDYDGALRPISQATYEKLSDVEKKKYTPPTQDEAIAYHKKAVELAEQEYKKSGIVKRFVWSMFDKFNLNDKKALGRVTRVIDGDTFEVQIGDKKEIVRMLLVDTPESTDEYENNPMPYGKEASEYTNKALIDKDVKIYFDGDERDNYNRILGYIEVDDKDFNEELLKKGYAQLRYLFQDKYKRLDKYRDAEAYAYRNKLNIWSLNGYATPGIDDGWNYTSR